MPHLWMSIFGHTIVIHVQWCSIIVFTQYKCTHNLLISPLSAISQSHDKPSYQRRAYTWHSADAKSTRFALDPPGALLPDSFYSIISTHPPPLSFRPDPYFQ